LRQIDRSSEVEDFRKPVVKEGLKHGYGSFRETVKKQKDPSAGKPTLSPYLTISTEVCYRRVRASGHAILLDFLGTAQ
jgi:hypothetical protein